MRPDQRDGKPSRLLTQTYGWGGQKEGVEAVEVGKVGEDCCGGRVVCIRFTTMTAVINTLILSSSDGPEDVCTRVHSKACLVENTGMFCCSSLPQPPLSLEKRTETFRTLH